MQFKYSQYLKGRNDRDGYNFFKHSDKLGEMLPTARSEFRAVDTKDLFGKPPFTSKKVPLNMPLYEIQCVRPDRWAVCNSIHVTQRFTKEGVTDLPAYDFTQHIMPDTSALDRTVDRAELDAARRSIASAVRECIGRVFLDIPNYQVIAGNEKLNFPPFDQTSMELTSPEPFTGDAGEEMGYFVLQLWLRCWMRLVQKGAKLDPVNVLVTGRDRLECTVTDGVDFLCDKVAPLAPAAVMSILSFSIGCRHGEANPKATACRVLYDEQKCNPAAMFDFRKEGAYKAPAVFANEPPMIREIAKLLGRGELPKIFALIDRQVNNVLMLRANPQLMMNCYQIEQILNKPVIEAKEASGINKVLSDIASGIMKAENCSAQDAHRILIDVEKTLFAKSERFVGRLSKADYTLWAARYSHIEAIDKEFAADICRLLAAQSVFSDDGETNCVQVLRDTGAVGAIADLWDREFETQWKQSDVGGLTADEYKRWLSIYVESQDESYISAAFKAKLFERLCSQPCFEKGGATAFEIVRAQDEAARAKTGAMEIPLLKGELTVVAAAGRALNESEYRKWAGRYVDYSGYDQELTAGIFALLTSQIRYEGSDAFTRGCAQEMGITDVEKKLIELEIDEARKSAGRLSEQDYIRLLGFCSEQRYLIMLPREVRDRAEALLKVQYQFAGSATHATDLAMKAEQYNNIWLPLVDIESQALAVNADSLTEEDYRYWANICSQNQLDNAIRERIFDRLQLQTKFTASNITSYEIAGEYDLRQLMDRLSLQEFNDESRTGTITPEAYKKWLDRYVSGFRWEGCAGLRERIGDMLAGQAYFLGNDEITALELALEAGASDLEERLIRAELNVLTTRNQAYLRREGVLELWLGRIVSGKLSDELVADIEEVLITCYKEDGEMLAHKAELAGAKRLARSYYRDAVSTISGGKALTEENYDIWLARYINITSEVSYDGNLASELAEVLTSGISFTNNSGTTPLEKCRAAKQAKLMEILLGKHAQEVARNKGYMSEEKYRYWIELYKEVRENQSMTGAVGYVSEILRSTCSFDGSANSAADLLEEAGEKRLAAELMKLELSSGRRVEISEADYKKWLGRYCAAMDDGNDRELVDMLFAYLSGQKTLRDDRQALDVVYEECGDKPVLRSLMRTMASDSLDSVIERYANGTDADGAVRYTSMQEKLYLRWIDYYKRLRDFDVADELVARISEMLCGIEVTGGSRSVLELAYDKQCPDIEKKIASGEHKRIKLYNRNQYNFRLSRCYGAADSALAEAYMKLVMREGELTGDEMYFEYFVQHLAELGDHARSRTVLERASIIMKYLSEKFCRRRINDEITGALLKISENGLEQLIIANAGNIALMIESNIGFGGVMSANMAELCAKLKIRSEGLDKAAAKAFAQQLSDGADTDECLKVLTVYSGKNYTDGLSAKVCAEITGAVSGMRLNSTKYLTLVESLSNAGLTSADVAAMLGEWIAEVREGSLDLVSSVEFVNGCSDTGVKAVLLKGIFAWMKTARVQEEKVFNDALEFAGDVAQIMPDACAGLVEAVKAYIANGNGCANISAKAYRQLLMTAAGEANEVLYSVLEEAPAHEEMLRQLIRGDMERNTLGNIRPEFSRVNAIKQEIMSEEFAAMLGSYSQLTEFIECIPEQPAWINAEAFAACRNDESDKVIRGLISEDIDSRAVTLSDVRCPKLEAAQIAANMLHEVRGFWTEYLIDRYNEVISARSMELFEEHRTNFSTGDNVFADLRKLGRLYDMCGLKDASAGCGSITVAWCESFLATLKNRDYLDNGRVTDKYKLFMKQVTGREDIAALKKFCVWAYESVLQSLQGNDRYYPLLVYAKVLSQADGANFWSIYLKGMLGVNGSIWEMDSMAILAVNWLYDSLQSMNITDDVMTHASFCRYIGEDPEFEKCAKRNKAGDLVKKINKGATAAGDEKGKGSFWSSLFGSKK